VDSKKRCKLASRLTPKGGKQRLEVLQITGYTNNNRIQAGALINSTHRGSKTEHWKVSFRMFKYMWKIGVKKP